jgi:serine/threonine protein phosphatase PrpC
MTRVIVAHVGDSRLYRLRGDDFVALTRDHSLLQEQLDSGLITAEEARHSTNRNLVTRAVGVDAEVDVEIHLHQVRRAISISSARTASTTWSMRPTSGRRC